MLEITSLLLDPDPLLRSPRECPRSKRSISVSGATFSRNLTQLFCSALAAADTGPMLEVNHPEIFPRTCSHVTIKVSSTITMRTFLSGSTRKITPDSSPWKREITSSKSSRKHHNFQLINDLTVYFQTICKDHFFSPRSSQRRRSRVHAL